MRSTYWRQVSFLKDVSHSIIQLFIHVPVCTQISDFIPLVKLWLSERRNRHSWTIGWITEISSRLQRVAALCFVVYRGASHSNLHAYGHAHPDTHALKHAQKCDSQSGFELVDAVCLKCWYMVWRPLAVGSQLMEREPVFSATTGSKLNELAPV